jgi:energy-coupling factor transporter ATP-binding protein EcfA2
VRGRIASLLELGAGFHPEFSGRDNIHLNCSMLGMGEEEIAERFPRIVEFSELGEFIDRPVKTYSSGMYVRLGFSVAASVDPDILLIDEALSVGDEHFRGKCLNRLNEFRDQGKTTVFVSHDIGAVKSMCQWVVLMDRGEVARAGHRRARRRRVPQARQGPRQRAPVRCAAAGPRPTRGGAAARSRSPRWRCSTAGAPHPGLRAGPALHASACASGPRPTAGTRSSAWGSTAPTARTSTARNHHWREHPIEILDVRAGEEGEVEMSCDRLLLLQGQYYLTSLPVRPQQGRPGRHRPPRARPELRGRRRASACSTASSSCPSTGPCAGRGPAATSTAESPS